MPLTEEEEIGMTIDALGTISVRTVNVIYRDGVEVGRSLPHRVALAPGEDVAAQHADVQAVAGALWTTARVKKYKDKLPPKPGA